MDENPSFARWFGDSQVVKPDGAPLVVYHGTGSDFSSFDLAAKPHHFDRDKGKVFFYADPAEASEYAEKVAAHTGGLANVIPVFLALKRPYVVHVEYSPSEEWDMAGGRFEREAPWGTDGYIVHGIDAEDRPATMYVALEPEQIKSSVGNSGSFDPSDPDMTDRAALRLESGKRAKRAMASAKSKLTPQT